MMGVKYNFKSSYLKKLFSDVQLEKIPLKIISRSKSKKKKKPSKALQKRYPYYGAWDRYIKHKLAKERIQKGIQFFKKYKSTLKKVETTYGIPAEYIVAIIGIESLYGHNIGKYGVFNTLTFSILLTLGSLDSIEAILVKIAKALKSLKKSEEKGRKSIL